MSSVENPIPVSPPPQGGQAVGAVEVRMPLPKFVWGAGVECSIIPHLGIDQFSWTQHDRFWADDFRKAREEAGLTHLRYSFPWHVLEPVRGRFDWSYSDQRIEEMVRLGIEPMLDVMHFGTPPWLTQAVGDPLFPQALEEFAGALVERYRDVVKVWCPCNEPLVLALFSGDYGFWPPHSRHWRGYMPVLNRIAQAVHRTINIIRCKKEDAVILLCDAAENYKTRHEHLRQETQRRNSRRFLMLDLLMGRVDPHHPLWDWLGDHGFAQIDLDWFKFHPLRPDIIGLDYYPHSDWQLEPTASGLRQRRAESPVGLYSLANSYYQRYSLPMMLTETSIEGAPINREIWLETTLDDVRRLREEGVPMLGYIWWPLIDQLDWDGALTHRIGKIHQVGLFSLEKQADGTLARNASSLVSLFRQAVDAGTKRIGELSFLAIPTEDRNQNIPLPENDLPPRQKLPDLREIREERLAQSQSASTIEIREPEELDDGHFGIVVFSHLRWGFVWQRPQQLLSRFARNHSILFIEEPLFDLADCQDSYMLRHRVMPNVVVGCPHFPRSFVRNARLPETLRKYVREAMSDLNETGQFSQPLLWYYSPMDASWSLGQFENRGIVYDAMDELSQFSGASPRLVDWENRLMEHADIVLAGGHQLWQKKRQSHDNAHFFGCGVEYDHFARAQASTTSIPPDIDFMTRPILGWFGVIDERVDYAILPEIARLRPDWSIAMVGPVVKVDPNLLPHAPNLFWLGQRDYQVLPNYCRAFDVCIMPFAQTPATEFINPTKVLEYFATGRPVISTPVQDVIRQYDGLVYIARDAGEFVETIERILKTPDTARLQRAMDMARSSSWDAIVVTIRELIRQSISRPDRRSARQLFLPMAEEDLDYSYVATQGS